MAKEKFKIKGNDKIPDFDSELEINVDDKYEAYKKDIPEKSTPIPGGAITWFNAFGIRSKETRRNANVTYTVTLHPLPKGKKLFALYGGKPHEIPTQEAGPGKISFTLNVGDPPTGAGP
jgi:hypothetical protein